MSIPFVHLHLHSHYSILDGMGRVLFVVVLIGISILSGCTREDDIATQIQEYLSSSVKSDNSERYVLPINFAKYNLNKNGKTKASADLDTSYSFNLDSLIDQENPRQVYYENSGWLYCQIPFKSNTRGVLAAIGSTPSNIKDSMVTLKSYFMQVSNLSNNKGSEYIVTLLPTKQYFLKHPDYDYIDKPFFSGVIFYSDKLGNLLRVEYLTDGYIHRSGLVVSGINTKNTARTKSTVYTCIECGSATYEADGVCIFCKDLELNSIVILADNIDWDNYISMKLQDLAGELDFISQGGGGGNVSGTGGCGIENTDMNVFITCRAMGCFNALLTIRILTKGSTFSYSSPLRGSEGSCWFREWNYESISSQYVSVVKNSIVIQSVQSNQTLNAVFATNNDCNEISEFMQDGTFRKVLDTLYYRITHQEGFLATLDNEWYSVLYNDSRGYHQDMGTKTNTKVPLVKISGITPSHQLVHHSHYHSSGLLRLSVADYVALCMFFLYDCSDASTSIYGLITKKEVMTIKMKDVQKFTAFINDYLIAPNTLDWYKEQTAYFDKNFRQIFKESKIYTGCNETYQNVNAVRSIIESMGLELYWGTTQIDEVSNQRTVVWNNLEYSGYTPLPLGCLDTLSVI